MTTSISADALIQAVTNAESSGLYLEAFERLLEALPHLERSLQSHRLKDVRHRLFRLLILSSPSGQVDLSKDFEDLIGQKSLALEAKQFFAVALLRVEIASRILDEVPALPQKAMKLYDDVMSQFVYSRIGIQGSAQSHEKRQRLHSHLREVESRLFDISKSLPDIAGIEQLRQRVLRFVNLPQNRTFLAAFVPDRILTALLPDALEAAAEFAADPTVWDIKSYEQVTSRLEILIENAEAASSQYARSVAEVAAIVSRKIEEGFRRSPASQPPQMAISATGKKYPFWNAGQEIWLTFQVRNEGPGDAVDVVFSVSDTTSNLSVLNSSVYLGRVPGGSERKVEIPTIVTEPSDSSLVMTRLSWWTAQGESEALEEVLDLMSQSPDIDWDNLALRDPYSSEPVTTTEELIGRRTILNELFSRAASKTMGSSYVWGQKRVGKTSVAKTLQSRLELSHESSFFTIYLEAGAFGDATPEGTIRRLGSLICKSIRTRDSRLQNISIPAFESSLSPLYDFILEAKVLVPDLKVLIILDEFDELPQTLYKTTDIGDQFFLALRSLSGLGYCAFLLVGGENMEYVINFQGHRLNKFKQFRVDYFGLKDQWNDFADLVRKPVESAIEVSDAALMRLFEHTAGNPFFTKLVGQEMLKFCIDRRDASVTEHEISMILSRTLDSVGINGFQHFWEDGIFNSDSMHEEVSISRKRVLTLLALCMDSSKDVDVDTLANQAGQVGLADSTVRREIQEFVRRGVLVENEGAISVRLRLFRDWLLNGGVQQLITTFADQELALERAAALESQRVSSKEIAGLVSGWGVYKGNRIGEEVVRAWLEQFQEGEERRIMFELLKGVQFVTTDEARQRMRESYKFVGRNAPGLRLDESRSKRSEFLVSHFGSIAKSGTRYAKHFVDENNIYADHAVEYSQISSALTAKHGIQVLVFIDDICGSGDSLRKHITELNADHGDTIRQSGVKVFVVYLTGYTDSIESAERVAESLGLGIRFTVSNPLGQEDRCFSENSSVFRSKTLRNRAQEIAQIYGARLQPLAPLGHKSSQSLVVFEHNCPNNTLPILWSTKNGWFPLFER